MSTVCSGQIINQLVSTSGSSFNNGQIQLDWSLGEVAIHAYELNSFMLTEGFHQPRYVITSTKVIKAGPIVKLFPNPTIDDNGDFVKKIVQCP